MDEPTAHGNQWSRLAARAFVRVALPLLVAAGLWARFIKWRMNSEEWSIRSCQENLHKIDGAKEQFALEHNLRPGDPVTWADLHYADGKGYLREMPKEPLGGTYQINPIGTDPKCSKGLPGHNIDGGCITTSVD